MLLKKKEGKLTLKKHVCYSLPMLPVFLALLSCLWKHYTCQKEENYLQCMNSKAIQKVVGWNPTRVICLWICFFCHRNLEGTEHNIHVPNIHIKGTEYMCLMHIAVNVNKKFFVIFDGYFLSYTTSIYNNVKRSVTGLTLGAV